MAKSKDATPTETLATLHTRRADLLARRGEVEATAAAARKARKVALATDAGSDLKPFNATIAEAADELDVIASVLADIGEEITKAEALAAADQTRVDREASADTLRAIANAVEIAAGGVDTAMAGLGAAVVTLRSAIPDTLIVTKIDGNGANPDAVVQAIFAEALFNVAPQLFTTGYEEHAYRTKLSRVFGLDKYPRTGVNNLLEVPPAKSASEAAGALAVTRLRLRADAIIAGDETTSLEDTRPPAPPTPKPAPPPPADIEIIAREGFDLQAAYGGKAQHLKRFDVKTISADLAAAAVVAGLAYRTDDPRVEGMRYENPPAQRGGQRWAIVRQQNGQVFSKVLTETEGVTITRVGQ